MTQMIPSQQALRDETHFRILRLLHENPELRQRDLARTLGVSTGGIHYALRALIDNFIAAPDKRRYAYVLTPKSITQKAALTARFLDRKLAEYDALEIEIEIETLRSELHAGNEEGADT